MSQSNSLFRYYISDKKLTTMHDIGSHRPLNPNECLAAHYYISPNPMGWYFDLGAAPIGQRPEYKSYEVGRSNCLTPTKYVEPAYLDCKQPCWCYKCK